MIDSATCKIEIRSSLSDSEVNGLENTSLCQLPSYFENVCHSLGYSPRYFVAQDGPSIVNFLPIAEVRKPFLGSKLVSMPLDGTFGGVVHENLFEREMMEVLIDYGRKKRMNFIEIRTSQVKDGLRELGFVSASPFITSDIDLIGVQENRKKFSKGHRSAVVFAQNNGLVTEVSKSKEDLDQFYKMFAINYRGFGTPVFPKRYIDNLWNQFLGKNKIMVIKGTYKGRMVSGILLLIHGKIAIYKYGAALKDFLFLRPYQAMLWKAIEYSIENQAVRFNMGITPKTNEGLLKFKEGCGAVHHDAYSYVLKIAGPAPDYDKIIDGYGFLKEIWKRLPLPATRLLGELVYSWVC